MSAVSMPMPMSASERAKTIVCLANLLMQAAGVATGERDDDER